MCAHYLFDADFCNVASGWEKGVVEKNVQDSRRRIWLDAPSSASARWPNSTPGWPSAAGRCGSSCATPSTRQFSVAEMLELERQHLMPMPAPFDGYVESRPRQQHLPGDRGAQPLLGAVRAGAAQMVSTRLYPNRVVIVADERVVAATAAAERQGQDPYDWQHYMPLVQRKPGALRNGAPFADLPEPLQQAAPALLRTRAATG
jgi:hypothetical protein